MFENNIFEEWLDGESKKLIKKIGSGESLSSEEMIVLVLKAQSNHFSHLDIDMREDMKNLREDLNKDMRLLREDMGKRFEQVDKRFEQVIGRMDKFMFWSLGLTVTSTFFILGFLKFGM